MKNKKIDETLFEMMIGIALFGLLSQLLGVWFVKDKSAYSIGLWIGTAVAEGAAFHMWWALNRALYCEQSVAVKVMVKHNILRYMAIVLVLGGIMISGFANPLSAFLGIMGMKVSAYIQPFTHKVCSKIFKENTKDQETRR